MKLWHTYPVGFSFSALVSPWLALVVGLILAPPAASQPMQHMTGNIEQGFRFTPPPQPYQPPPPPSQPPPSQQPQDQQRQYQQQQYQQQLQHYQRWRQQTPSSSQQSQRRARQAAQMRQQARQIKQNQLRAIINYQNQLRQGVLWENGEELNRVERKIKIDQAIVEDLEEMLDDHLGWWNWLLSDNAVIVGQMAGTISIVCEGVFTALDLDPTSHPVRDFLSAGFTSLHEALWTGRLTPAANAKRFAQVQALDALALKMPVFGAAKGLASVLKHAQDVANLQNDQKIFRRDFKQATQRLQRAINRYNERIQYNKYQQRYIRHRDAKVQNYLNIAPRTLYFIEYKELPPSLRDLPSFTPNTLTPNLWVPEKLTPDL